MMGRLANMPPVLMELGQACQHTVCLVPGTVRTGCKDKLGRSGHFQEWARWLGEGTEAQWGEKPARELMDSPKWVRGGTSDWCKT